MKYELSYEEIHEMIKNKEKIKFIDMRSPREFNENKIPGAINLPILDDEERKIVGTTYVKESVKKAKYLGINFAKDKLPAFYEKVIELTENYDHVIIYCSRGGYRSNVFFTFLRALNVNVKKLIGGYKAYRKYINENLDNLIAQKNFVVLCGKTGVGKTEILKILSSNFPVLNLEKLASHRGSIFGGIGLNNQPSQKYFESLLFEALDNEKKIFFTEGESAKIGNIQLPKILIEKISSGKKIIIEDKIENRIARIKRDYNLSNKDEIYKALIEIKKFISAKKENIYLEKFYEGDYDFLIRDLLLNYYDPNYKKNYSKEDLHLTNDSAVIKNILNFKNSI
ncbi:MAG: tRNA 2-selenouridine(34) synthase MnmH [Peptoniphilus sp.]|uniref:tRNA 2-selenouridine(34) synthase MnmH n=1 Tax=Peptoniphilus sp. TaxID=1971214 RepID=UPI0025F86CB8|nr:tRNA 2-selenouridine(34) synthase MnmH [Peptoniphilus sp.]MCI5643582.1 tRNA 2-selenouridine(34) synthase MnmH [Peptoniphilus sp.]MDD7353334.1 tRNA 2-selenouridine(34) synthase MnmH [Peptoniphilaceae bacterium]